MDVRLQTAAETAARQLLAQFKAANPAWHTHATPIEWIAGWLNLTVESFDAEDYPPGTYGWLEPGEDLIWLQRNLPDTLRRFTLAHELGHALLHRTPETNASKTLREISASIAKLTSPPYDLPHTSSEDPCNQPDIQEDLTMLGSQEKLQEVLGIGQAYNPRGERELTANIFAAELLIPRQQVHALYLNQHLPASRLASSFGVSQAALFTRLAELLTEPTTTRSTDQATVKKGDAPVQAPSAPRRYDQYQQAAIEAPTPALIVAGPGSGKTSTLIGRARYLIQQQQIPANQILALTFSRKAAKEMQERLQSDLGPDQVLPLVSTFHAYCAEVLRKHGHLLGMRPDFRLLDETEGYFILREVYSHLSLQHYRNLKFPPQHFPNILKAISRAKDELITPDQYLKLAQQMQAEATTREEQVAADQASELALIYAHYEEALQRQGDTDFGGLIMQTIHLFEQIPSALQAEQDQYVHILVDEFQDINRASGILLQTLAGTARRVWVVGDANQAIYGFRGASPANIANFTKEYPGATILPLSRNYRSQPDIVTLAETFRAEKLSSDSATSVKNEAARSNSTDPYLTLAVAESESDELAGIITDMRRKLDAGYTYRDLVVLCRTRSQARKISRALARAGFPLTERGEMLEQSYIKDLLALLLLVCETSGMGLLRVVRQPQHFLSPQDTETLLLTARARDISPLDLLTSAEYPATISEAGQHSLYRLATTIKSLGRATSVWSLLAQYLFSETGLVRDLIKQRELPGNASRLQDYATLLHVAQTYDQRQLAIFNQSASEADEQGLEPPAPPTLQEQVSGFLDYLNVLITLRQDTSARQDASQGEDSEPPDVVRVMTVHASKGLEFPVVYLPGIAHNRVPSIYRPSGIAAPQGMLPPGSEGKPFHESGEASLFYVGITRAREHLVISHSARYGKLSSKPSTYLDILKKESEELPEDRIIQLQWSAELTETAPTQAEEPEEVLPLLQPSEAFIEKMLPATLNSSAIETYRICPRRYLYNNVYHFQRAEGPYQRFWQALNKTLNLLPKAGEPAPDSVEETPTLSRQHLQEHFQSTWHELGGKEQPFASMYEQHGREVIEHIWRAFKSGELGESGESETPDTQANWELHRNVTAEVEGHKIQISVDRVESLTSSSAQEQPSTKPLKFVRTSFGKSQEAPKAREREWLYREAYRQLYPRQEPEIYNHNLSTGEMLPITIGTRSEKTLKQKILNAIEGIQAHEYPVAPDQPARCPGCPFFLICPV